MIKQWVVHWSFFYESASSGGSGAEDDNCSQEKEQVPCVPVTRKNTVLQVALMLHLLIMLFHEGMDMAFFEYNFKKIVL